MGQDLCPNCGHELPASVPKLYCNNCGEPVYKSHMSKEKEKDVRAQLAEHFKVGDEQ